MLLRQSSDTERLAMALQAEGLELGALSLEQVMAVRKEFRQRMVAWRTEREEADGYRWLAASLLADDGESAGRLAARLADYHSLYREVPGVRAVLEELGRLGVPQGVVSEWPPSLRAFLRYHDLDRYFRTVVGTADHGVVKPSLPLIRAALDELGLEPEQAVFVGNDPEKDMNPARELGMPVIHFNPGGEYPEAHARDAAGLRARLAEVLGVAL